MSWILYESDLKNLAVGAALLGTGGGGDPHVGRLLASEAMKVSGPLTILDPQELADDVLVIPAAQMGAPTVIAEKLPAGSESESAFTALEKYLGKPAFATMPIECGGINSMIPLQLAARKGLPVIDGDGMGRAFPELQMETFSVYGVSGSPMSIAGVHGEFAVIDAGSDNKRMEDIARAITIQFGGAAAISDYAMTGAEVKRTAVPNTLSMALNLGRAVEQAKKDNADPIDAIAVVLSKTIYTHLVRLFSGKVIDVERHTDGGFVRGQARISSPEGDELVIAFQNENLTAHVNGKLLCIVPDLICVLEAEKGIPITTETLQYGQRVKVVGISTPDLMRTPEALNTFGPKAFGLADDFSPVEVLARSIS